MPSFEKMCIYISLLFLIIVLLVLKRRLEVESRIGDAQYFIKDLVEEKFTNSSFLAEIVAGQQPVFKINSMDILSTIPANRRKNNAMYLAIVKVDGKIRIVDSYSTGTSKEETSRLMNDIQKYVYGSKLLDDKYLIMFSYLAPGTYIDDTIKKYMRENFKATKFSSIMNITRYIFIYDLIDKNVRFEELSDNLTNITFKDTLFATKRSLTYNSDGLMTTGLQCYLDATRKESYSPEFDRVWKDISGNNRHFTWQTKPQFGDGQMLNTLKYGNLAVGPNGDRFDLGNGSQGFAIILYSKTNTMRNSHAFLFEGITNLYGIQSHITWGEDSVVYFDQGWPWVGAGRNRVQVYQADWAEYHVWAFVRAFDGSLKIYKDGNLIVTGVVNGATPLNLKSVPVRLNVNWDANISKFLVYNTHLMPEDVKSISEWILKDEQTQRMNRMKALEGIIKAPIPVKLGLQCYLDSKNYNPGDLLWKDQSGNGFDFRWNAAPQVENGSILMNRGEYALSTKGSRMLNIDAKDTYTICWTGKTNQLSTNSVFKIMGHHLMSRGIFVHPTWVNNYMYFDQAGCCDDNAQRLYADISKFSKDFAFYCIRKTKNERAIYVNGIKMFTRNTSGAPVNINDEPTILGRDLQQNYTWYGNLKNFMVYNRDLSDVEIKKIYDQMFSNYDIGKFTYDESEQFCRKRGKKLCKADEYCKNNKPLYPNEGDLWGAIGDYPNGWIQLGSGGEQCKTYKQRCELKKDATCDVEGNPVWGSKKERDVGILCCDVKYQPLLINAIHRSDIGDTSKLTFFRDKSYQEVQYKSNKLLDVSKVLSIDKFKGLTANFSKGDIDAITITKDPNVSLWFKGSFVMLYDQKAQKGREMTISEYFSKLSDDFISGNVDAVATKGPNTEYILFKKTKYCIIDMVTRTKTSEGLLSAFSSLPQDFKLGFLDCAVYSNRPNCSYLFKNDKLIEFNFANKSIVKGPIDISMEFGYLLPPFSAKSQVCKVYEKLSNLSQYWKNKYYKQCKRIVKQEYELNLGTYKKLVDQYNEQVDKSKADAEKIKKQVEAFEKALENKRNEMLKLENKLLEIRSKPCKKDEVCKDGNVKRTMCSDTKKVVNKRDGTKQIIIKEKQEERSNPNYNEVDSRKVETCFYDPNVGKQFEGGFNVYEHPDFKKYIDSKLVKEVYDFDIKDHPEYSNYIPKNKIPRQRTAADFDIRDHPDYSKYLIKQK